MENLSCFLDWKTKVKVSVLLGLIQEESQCKYKSRLSTCFIKLTCWFKNLCRHADLKIYVYKRGTTCIPVADSFWYLAKLIQFCKVKKK